MTVVTHSLRERTTKKAVHPYVRSTAVCIQNAVKLDGTLTYNSGCKFKYVREGKEVRRARAMILNRS